MKININIKKNIGIKIASLVFALFLWFLVSSSEYITTSVYAPIDIDNLKKGYIALTDEQMINLALRGSSLVLKGIDSKNVKVEIDVSSFKPGKNRYVVKEKDIKTPPGVEILSYQPKAIEVYIDKMIEKDLKVIPHIIGKAKSGLYMESVKLNPEFVKARGALTILNTLTYLETMPINISEITEDQTLEIPIKLIEGIKDITPKSVNAEINIEDEIIEKDYKNVPVEIYNKTSYRVKNYTPNRVRVKLRGRSDILVDNDIESLIETYVEVDNIDNPGTYIRNISYRLLHKKVEVVYIIPEVIRVEVE
jgi:YbbR domain-containing protein